MADYICGPSLVMIGQKLRPVSQKMWQFHLNMNIEGTLWRHAVTSLVTSSLWKSFWWMIYILSFYTCCQIEAILKTAKLFKLTKIWGPGELFHHKCQLWQFQNLAYFLTWWPSFVTYLIVQVTCGEPVTQYIYGSNLVMICQSVRELCMKMR